MPTLVRLPDCTLSMYAADHLPPHFHGRLHDGREALVQILGLVVLRSSQCSRRELAAALAWAGANQALLDARWKELNP